MAAELASEGIDLPVFENEQYWYGKDLQQRSDWIYELSEREQLEVRHAIAKAIAGNVDLVSMTAADFALGSFGVRLLEIGREIKHGRGFALIRGLNTMGLTLTEQAYAFRGVGAHFGEAVSQNAKGHVLGHVTNLGLDYSDPTTRGYQTPAELRFHTDAADIVGLMCVRGARSGGLSRIASSTTVWNEVVRRRPDLVRALLKTYSFTRWGEIRPGQRAHFDIPLFHPCGDRLIAVFISGAIEKAQALPGVAPLTPTQREAIALVDELASDDSIRLDMEFRPGDMQFLLNHATLHSRTAYEDWPEPEKRRHLLRLWLACPDGPALPDYMTTEFQGRTASGRPDGVRLPGVELKANLDPD
ncbi:TauD/TfdA family dioxygenase [Paraburkholderia sediminicola]|uniref:TauD/TfdA family dioxygenase n=1 Tax=Paraburkholderia sediminicola TaxID=458836 RepID=UPI000F13AD58